jgi:hypothetical protein
MGNWPRTVVALTPVAPPVFAGGVLPSGFKPPPAKTGGGTYFAELKRFSISGQLTTFHQAEI